MHGAPSVTYPVGRSRFAGAFMLSAWLLAVAGAALWATQSRSSAAALFGAACTLVAGGGLAWRGWQRSAAGTLEWNGEAWNWSAGRRTESGTPEPVLDLQRILLLRWTREGGAVRWLWAERRVQPSAWDDLRRAVYSRARPGVPPSAPEAKTT